MKRMVRYGLHAVIVLLICVSLVVLTSQSAYASTAEKEAAISAFRSAMDALPPYSEITLANSAAIANARRLADIAINDYGATRFELCMRLAILERMEKKLEWEADRAALPPTGGSPALLLLGMAITGTGLVLAGRSRKLY